MFYRVTITQKTPEGFVFDSGYEYESKKEMFEDLTGVIFENITIYESKDGRKWQQVKIEDVITLDDAERQPCEIWSRVMGYHRPVDAWNKGKKEEFYQRKCFTEEKAKQQL